MTIGEIEVTLVFGVSLLAGAVVGAFTSRVLLVIVSVIVFELVAAPLIYYAQPFLEHGSAADYRMWALIGIPMVGLGSGMLTLVAALIVILLRRAACKRRENI